MATEQIIIEYVAVVEGLKAQLKTVQSELKAVQKTADDSAKEATKSFEGAGASIKSVATSMATSLGLAFSVQKIVQFANESIKAFREAEEASKKLEFAVTRIGKEGSEAFEKLTKQADKLSKISIFSDEDIKGSQTLLAQFGLQSREIEKLIPKIIDLASATGQDLNSATSLAIAGINGQGRALKPYGIVLNDTGDKVQNLALLTEGLTKFTGSAGEAFNSAAGQAKFLDNQVNELQESVGGKLSPALQGIQKFGLEILNSYIDQATGLFDLTKDFFKSEETKKQEALDEDRAFIKKYQAGVASDAQGAAIIAERLTAKGIADKEDAIKKAAEEEKELHKKSLEDYNKLLEEQAKSNQRLLEQKADDEQKYYADKRKREKESADAENEAAELNLKPLKDRLDKKTEKEQEINDAAVELFTQSANAIFEYQKQLDDQQLSNLQKNLDGGIISQQVYDEKVAEIKTKAAKRDKEQAIFNITIATAEAVIKAFASGGPVLAGIAAALGAVQLAAVIARPIPKFAEGVIDLQGGIRGKDSIPAILMPGESVMTTEETQRHGELLRSIRSKSLDEYLMDNYITPKLSAILGNSTADNIAKSAKLNGLNEYSLARVMSRNKGVNVQNSDYIAKAIAREMSNQVSYKLSW